MIYQILSFIFLQVLFTFIDFFIFNQPVKWAENLIIGIITLILFNLYKFTRNAI